MAIRWLLLGLLLCASLSMGAEKPKETFAVSPRISIWAFRPVPVFARLVVENPTPDFLCRGQMFSWGDGDVSIRESDCLETELPKVLLYSGRHNFKLPGTYIITLILFSVDEKGKANAWRKYEQQVWIR